MPASDAPGLNPLNHRPVRYDRVFRDDDDAVADEIKCVVNTVGFSGGRNRHVVPDARVLVNDGVLDLAVRADADPRDALALVLPHGFVRFVEVAAQDDDAVQFRSRADKGSQTHDGAFDARVVDDAAVGDERVVNLGAVDLRAGQKARARKNGRAHVKKIEARQFGHQVKIRREV